MTERKGSPPQPNYSPTPPQIFPISVPQTLLILHPYDLQSSTEHEKLLNYLLNNIICWVKGPALPVKKRIEKQKYLKKTF